MPYFWGIDPGNSSLDDTIDFFQSFGINRKYAVALYIFSRSILNRAVLFEEERKIVGIEVFGEGRLDEISTIWEIWTEYLPQNIIDKYGYPDRVWFDTYNNPEVPTSDKPFGYSIWFFYDTKGLLLVYSGITTKSPQYQVCLGGKTGENRFGNLNPNIKVLIRKDIHLEEFASERGIDTKVSFYSEKNAEIPMDKFRSMIEKQDGCFNTPPGSHP